MNATGWVLFLLFAVGIAFTWQLNSYQRSELKRVQDAQYNDYHATMQGRIDDMQRQVSKGEDYIAKKEAEFADLDAAKLRTSTTEKEIALQTAREKLGALKADIGNVDEMWRSIQNMQRDPALRDAEQ